MRVNKYLMFGLFFLLLMPIVNAVPPVTTEFVGNEGLDIQANILDYYKINTAAELHFHIFNISNGAILNSSVVNCSIELTNSTGGVILSGSPAGDGDHFVMIRNASIVSEAGTYAVTITCTTDGIGGVKTAFFEANKNGQAVEDSNAIVYIGVLFFVFILSLAFMIMGGTLLRGNDHIKWGGILLVCLGAVLLYGATFMANNYIIMMTGAMGGEALMSGFFLFFARMLKYSPYLVMIMVIYFIIKWRKSISDATPDGWDNNLYS